MSNDLFTYYDIIVDIYGNMSLYSIQYVIVQYSVAS